ncbi:MAG TPA: Gfo/Idh/MocA family oxidoreductase [Phycisphaerae bacterium]|nr:Gfo/Idh/MocA family oxidoreductase [Phycisphaerae bacterium]
MKKVRYGVVGLGNMGVPHARHIVEDKNRQFCLSAVCDLAGEKAAKLGEELKVPSFTDACAMYDSGLIDAVIIAVPHYAHGPLAVHAARRGIHVLCEKPLSSSVSHARAMIAECHKRKVKLGVVLQHRTFARNIKARQLVQSGALGEVFRVQMICSNWFRSQGYYDSGAWRGTWDGEGGGVLINQAPHSLDQFQWVGLGLPKRITAFLATREHKIEVEDTANIFCDYGGGRHGYIYATTAEEPGMDQIILSGDKATLIVDHHGLRLGKLKIPLAKHIYGTKKQDVIASAFGGPKQQTTWTDVKIPDRGNRVQHIEIIRGFTKEILTGKGAYACGEGALNELEISNAAYLSGYLGKTISLPVDGAAMDRLLAKLEKERSTGRGQGARKKYYAEMKKLLAKK